MKILAARARLPIGPWVLALVLAVPSLFLVESRLGDRAIPVYLAYVVGLAWLWWRFGDRLAAGLGERRARVLAVGTLVLLIALFAVVYPLANSGRFGRGSDCDEALNQATQALLSGHFPYRERTYLGNEITPMPGELLFAAPFVLLGNGAYQTFLWIVAGALMLRACFRQDTAKTLLFCWLVLAASPAVALQIVTGADYVANTLMVLCFAVLLIADGPTSSGRGKPVLIAVALGLALATRANFVFVVPLVFSRLCQTRGAARAVALTGLVGFTAAAVTLPFLLFDPAHFSPLHVRTKLAVFDPILPHAALVIPLAAGVLSLALSRPRWNASTGAFLRNTAIVQALLVLAPTALWIALGLKPPLVYTAFGQFFLFFALGGIVAGSTRLTRSEAFGSPA
jgi:hypothetical protein